MIRKRACQDIKSEINVVPLMDVLLVLVLICMATAPIVIQNISVDLPNVTDFKTIHHYDDSPVIIEVTDIDQYNLIFNQNRQGPLSSKEVSSEVRARIISNDKTIFLVGGTKDAPYHEIIKALDLLRQAGVRSVGLMTKPI